MKSLDELKKIREQAKKRLEMRVQASRVHVNVYMGTCGIAAGAREAMSAILDELAKHEISDVEVLQKGCIGLCEQEPLVEVELPKQEPVLYGFVDADRARRIINKHVLNGQVLDEWIVDRQ